MGQLDGYGTSSLPEGSLLSSLTGMVPQCPGESSFWVSIQPCPTVDLQPFSSALPPPPGSLVSLLRSLRRGAFPLLQPDSLGC